VPSLLLFFLQLAVVIVAARAVGALFRRIRQPQVMGEMVAGILLGPSFFGWLAPGPFAALFPPASLGALQALSQTGLLLFMFLVGLELNPKLLRGRGHTAVVTSHASIIAPFLLGSVVALHLYPRYSDAGVPFAQFALFMGASMSITAFPVLARILTERNLVHTRVGAVTIACAAVDDVTAWCILAGVVALVRASGPHGFVLTLAGSTAYVLFMLKVGRPALRRLEAYYHTRGRLTQGMVAIAVLLVLASAWTTERLGIHALFGAFLLGAIMPKEHGFVHELTVRLEDLTLVLLLPLFFAFTGLRTQVGLLEGAGPWLDCALVIGVAVLGKLGGSSVAARLSGLGWREAGALGVLMNTRGLMELVILSIGLDLGVISPVVFVMMVLMALVTTFMTTPLLEWIYPAALIRQETLGAAEAASEAVLVPVALPSSGPELLAVARAIAPGPAAPIYALHLVRPDDRGLLEAGDDAPPAQQAALLPLLGAAQAQGVEVRPLSFTSRSFGEDIVEVARVKGAGLVLLGWHKPVLSRSILGGNVYEVMRRARSDVAVYVGRRAPPWSRVLVPFTGGPHDRAALELAGRIAASGSAEVTVLHVVRPARDASEARLGVEALVAPMGPDRVTLRVVESADPLAAVVEAGREVDLIVVGASGDWGLEPTFLGAQHERLAELTASMLIVRRGADSAPAPGAAAPVRAAA
jgi:Kef-type K+ transport system membrane component KefB/nucleotide-binding universal stress UspA family protein